MQELLRPRDGRQPTNLNSIADPTRHWSFTGGPFGSNLKSSDYTDEGVRIIQLQNIGDGEFRNDYEIYTSSQKADECTNPFVSLTSSGNGLNWRSIGGRSLRVSGELHWGPFRMVLRFKTSRRLPGGTMKKMLIVLCSVVLIAAFASAQIKPLASPNSGNPPAKGSQPSFCSPCLWYSGDFDPNYIYANGLFNADATAYYGTLYAQTYVPFAPQPNTVPIHHGIQTKTRMKMYSATFTEQITDFGLGASDFTGATYDIRKNLGGNPGFAGSSVASGTCLPTTPVDTGILIFGFYEQYLITCTFPTPITIQSGQELWINVLPAFNGGDYGYLADSEDMPPLNGFNAGNGGYWGNVTEASYFNSPYFGYTFAPAATLGAGNDSFSIAIAGVYF
jgi:hypothetical protein